MPEEILIIVIFSIVSGSILSMVRMILGYRERTRGVVQTPPAKLSASTSSSITTSELERLMRSAVQDATAPLAERISRLEKTGAGPQAAVTERAEPAARSRIDEISDQEIADLSPEDDVIKTRLRVR